MCKLKYEWFMMGAFGKKNVSHFMLGDSALSIWVVRKWLFLPKALIPIFYSREGVPQKRYTNGSAASKKPTHIIEI
jgi:hypothetical protein